MSRKYQKICSLCLIAAPVLCFLICLGVGRYHISLPETVELLLSPLTGAAVDETAFSVIFKSRLPRLLLALAVGAGLSVAGGAFQSLFSNPLATPDTLGVATGASFGAVLALLFTRSQLVVQLLAMAMGLAALLLTCLISRRGGHSSMVMVVLSGMVISSFFSALVSLAKYVADPEEDLPAITYWLMGSMNRATLPGIAIGVPLIAAGTAIILCLRWRLNILSLQEDEARSLGVNVRRMRLAVMAASTLITASCMSMCGQVGWVGLLIPHACRMIYGSDNRRLIPAGIGMGAAFLVIIDTAARSATAAEIPVSILTAILGAPFFILLLRKTGGAKL